jgi:phosphate transport system substrate-binding protein
MRTNLKVAALAAVAALGLGAGAVAAPEKTIQVKGSDTMVNLGQAWAEAFMKRHPDSSIAVTGGGSGTGIAALINGTCDVAECSRAMKPREIDQAKKQGREPKEIKVAVDALVVAVHPKNPINKLTIADLSDIYTGKKTSWKDFGGPDAPITVLSRERNSGTHVYFLEHVVRKGNDKGPEEYAKTALMLPSSQAIVDEVASNEKAIGYYGLGYLGTKNKALAVLEKAGAEGVLPSIETAMAGKYPISRPLFLYTPGEPAGDVKHFVDFCLSADGQNIVEKMDFVPLKR